MLQNEDNLSAKETGILNTAFYLDSKTRNATSVTGREIAQL